MKQNNEKTNLIDYVSKKYGNSVLKQTSKYQKKYGFQIGKGEHATWNNEADAFKHTFMQAQLSLLLGDTIAKALGDYHEYKGNVGMGQPRGENNMDNWNNAQGREIANEIKREYGITILKTSDEAINDAIAKKIMERMHNGQLITNPNDKRQYKSTRNFFTGGASQVDINRIFTAEDIGNMSNQEFADNLEYIENQGKNYGIPRKNQAEEAVISGDLIWVDDYVRSDGTQVHGYYRKK